MIVGMSRPDYEISKIQDFKIGLGKLLSFIVKIYSSPYVSTW